MIGVGVTSFAQIVVFAGVAVELRISILALIAIHLVLAGVRLVQCMAESERREPKIGKYCTSPCPGKVKLDTLSI